MIDHTGTPKVSAARSPWHCWLLDVDLGMGKSGIDIIEKFPNFPFIAVLSGLRSMHLASDAISRGAMYAFDKKPALFGSLLNTVSRIVALGYVLDGKGPHPEARFFCNRNRAIPWDKRTGGFTDDFSG